jgi:hypothetical protein
MKVIWLLFAVLLTISACSPAVSAQYQNKTGPSNEDFYFGVTFGGNSTSEAKLLIDKVKGYTNLFVVDNWDIAMNETALNEICDYAVAAKLNIMVYFSFLLYNYTINFGNFYNSSTWNDFGISPFHMAWLNSSRERWGDKFLGVYLYDEPGGKQIDVGYYTGSTKTMTGNITTFRNVANYTQAANLYVSVIRRSTGMQQLTNSSVLGSIPNSTGSVMPVFTADYALYWFDYLAGYDAVFAELGGNNSKAEQIALCRGAANVQDKQWGTMITWAYDNPPYLESAKDMLQDMMTSYLAGANYVIIFNYPQINPYGALTEDDFTAMKTFWNQIHASPRNASGKAEDQVALVLPKDYGSGMRNPDDNIWGLWPADNLSLPIWDKITTLINEYGTKLDIIYDDPQFNFTEKYSKIYYWNGTTYISQSSLSNAPPPYELYATLVVGIIGTCVPSYFVLKRKKRRPPPSISTGTVTKASLANFGSGKLELVDNTIKFHVEKGYPKKRKEIAREIPITDIESVKQIGSEFSVTWKGVTDTFVVEQTELTATWCKRINEALAERRMLQNKEAARQKWNETTKMLGTAMKVVDSLSDVLRSLQGLVDWNRVESYSTRSEEYVRNFNSQKIGAIDLDFTKLSLAIKEHLAEDTSKEAYSILRSLYEHFSGLASKNEFPEQIRPNYQDAKTTITAYYTLNDIILGKIVGDQEIGKESDELVKMLDDLSKRADLKIKVDAMKETINKLGTEKGEESLIEKGRAVFTQQLKELITA